MLTLKSNHWTLNSWKEPNWTLDLCDHATAAPPHAACRKIGPIGSSLTDTEFLIFISEELSSSFGSSIFIWGWCFLVRPYISLLSHVRRTVTDIQTDNALCTS